MTTVVGSSDYEHDDVLVPGLRGGDDAAFAWLIDRYSPSLRRLARTYVATGAMADDVVQDTWVAVFTGIERFEGRSSLKTWVHRILVNIARSKGVKEHRSIPFASLGAELDAHEPAVAPDRFRGAADRWPGHWSAPPAPWDVQPESRLMSDETVALVRDAIGELPPSQQTVITLRDIEGWGSAEVCNALDISETNQRVLLHRARSKVRRALEVHIGGEVS